MDRTFTRSFSVALLVLGLGIPVTARAQDSGAAPGAKGTTPAPGGDNGNGAAPGGTQGDGGNGQGGQNQGGQNGPNGQGRRGQRGNGGGRGMQGIVDRIKDELKLSDDQVAKAKGIEDAARADMQKLRDEMQNGGDRQAMRQKMQESRDKIRADVRAILTPDQQTKFDDLVKQMDAQRGQRGQRGQNGQNGDQGGDQGPGRGGRDPAARAKRLLDEAEKALSLSPDEKAAVLPLVKKLIDARSELRTADEKRRTEVKDFLKDHPSSSESDMTAIAAKLKDVRKAHDTANDAVKAAEKELREVLSVDNEAKLMSIGVLD